MEIPEKVIISDDDVTRVIKEVGEKAIETCIEIYQQSDAEGKQKIREIGPYILMKVTLETFNKQAVDTIDELKAQGINVVQEYKRFRARQN